MFYLTPFEAGFLLGAFIGASALALMDAYSGWKLMLKQQQEKDR